MIISIHVSNYSCLPYWIEAITSLYSKFFSYEVRVIINFLPHRTFADQREQHL